MTKSKQTINCPVTKPVVGRKRAPCIATETAPGGAYDIIANSAVAAVKETCADASVSAKDALPSSSLAKRTTQLDRLVVLLRRPAGTSLAELCTATGWQAHSVRGALAGTLKHKGFTVTSEKVDGLRRYRITVPA